MGKENLKASAGTPVAFHTKLEGLSINEDKPSSPNLQDELMTGWAPITEITLLSGVRLVTVFPLPTTGIKTMLRFDSCLLFFILSDLATAFGRFGDRKCLYFMVGQAVSPLLIAGVGLTSSNQFTQGLHMAAKKDHRVS